MVPFSIIFVGEFCVTIYITETVTGEKQLSAWESFLMTLGKLTLTAISIWLAVIAIKKFIVNK